VNALKSWVPRLAGLGGIIAAGKPAVYVVLGLLVVLVITATFVPRYREAAMRTLALLTKGKYVPPAAQPDSKAALKSRPTQIESGSAQDTAIEDLAEAPSHVTQGEAGAVTSSTGDSRADDEVHG
jgi:hypothetical protein